jgi:hypothetical protein
MGTRSAIGYIRARGHGKNHDIRAVYCHWDGYPSNQVPILTEHYNTVAKVRKLIAPGSMSSLRTTRTWVEDDGQAAHPGMPPEREAQPLYHAERGNHGPWAAAGSNYAMPAVSCASLKEAKAHWREMGCEHLYLYLPREGWRHYNLYEEV